MNLKTGQDLAQAAIAAAENYKTLYVMGCFGAPMTRSNKDRYTQNHSYNRKAARTAMINAADVDTFGFDCVCFIKGLLWGWEGDASKVYGGAEYQANGVPDINADAMILVCSDVSADFSGILPGEAVWMKGHIGIYVGDGLVAECTPKWKNSVQLTGCGNLGSVDGYPTRTWTSHGKLPYVTYSEPVEQQAFPLPQLSKGSRNDAVRALQALLVGYGYSCGSSGVDGIFGKKTDAALRTYQKEKGLDADGIAGPITWRSLLGFAGEG